MPWACRPSRSATESDPAGGVKRFGEFQTAGLEVSWREHPFEWVEGQRMGVVREFTRGPFRWFVSIVELTPRGNGGTTLEHTVLIAAKGLFGRLMANLKIGRQGAAPWTASTAGSTPRWPARWAATP